MGWGQIWICWLGFLIVADIIADRWKGATFSEHGRVWFFPWSARINLALFFVALYFHLVPPYWPVWPIAVLGTGIMFFVGRIEMKGFRLDKAFSGAIYAGLITVGGMIPVVLSDAVISKAEIWMMAITFVGAFVGWLKTHPPAFITDEQKDSGDIVIGEKP